MKKIFQSRAITKYKAIYNERERERERERMSERSKESKISVLERKQNNLKKYPLTRRVI